MNPAEPLLRSTRLLVLLATALLPRPLAAHPGRILEPEGVWTAWNADPWILLALGVGAWLYARGVGRVWGRAGRGRGVTRWQFRAFCAGLVVVAVATLSPLHALGGALFAAHMLQHELLILIAAPLLALGAPGVAFAWGTPRPIRDGIRRLLRRSIVAPVRRAATHPLGAWAIHGVALWIWHEPRLYQATLSSELAHAAQHASFFGTALLFWWVLLDLRRFANGYGVGVLMVFTTMLHGNALGALLTFAGTGWYPAYAETAPRWGLTGLEDQQLGGLVMWIPAGMVYLLAALLLLAAWLRMAESRSAGGARSPATPAAPAGSR